jgi:hypothetical protein
MTEFEDYMTPEQREAYERKLGELSRQDAQTRWAEGQAGKFCGRILKAYQDYEDYLKRNYSARRDADYVEAISQDLYLKLRENLAKADEAERCIHLKSSGRRCGSPRMNKSTLCFAHARLAETRPETMDLPPLEDANSVQLAIMKLAQWVIDGKMDPGKATKVAYIIQVAANNVGRVNFEEKER